MPPALALWLWGEGSQRQGLTTRPPLWRYSVCQALGPTSWGCFSRRITKANWHARSLGPGEGQAPQMLPEVGGPGSHFRNSFHFVLLPSQGPWLALEGHGRPRLPLSLLGLHIGGPGCDGREGKPELKNLLLLHETADILRDWSSER